MWPRILLHCKQDPGVSPFLLKLPLICLLVFFRVERVPEFLAEVFRLVAYALQIVEVFRRDFLKRLPHATH